MAAGGCARPAARGSARGPAGISNHEAGGKQLALYMDLYLQLCIGVCRVHYDDPGIQTRFGVCRQVDA